MLGHRLVVGALVKQISAEALLLDRFRLGLREVALTPVDLFLLTFLNDFLLLSCDLLSFLLG